MPDITVNTSTNITNSTTNIETLSATVTGQASLGITISSYPTVSAVVSGCPVLNAIYVAGPQGREGPPGTGNAYITGLFPVFYDAGSGVVGITNGYYATHTNLVDTSGILAAQIAGANAGVRTVNGLSGNLYIDAVNPLFISANGQTIIISGSGLANSGDINNLSNRLVQTGANLYGFASGISGYLQNQIDSAANGVVSVNGLSGNLNVVGAGNISISNNGQNIVVSGNTGDYALFATKTQLEQTGDNLINYANSIGNNLSGNLFQSGSNLYALITGASGQANSNYATIINLGLTGQSLYSYYTGLSRSLQITGQTLIDLIGGLSGVTNYLYGHNLVYTTGDQNIGGSKTFVTGIGISGNGIDFINNITDANKPAWKEGRVFYDYNEHTLAYYNDSNDVTVNIGQENIVRVVNQWNSTITNGMVVYISGAQGQRPRAFPAIASNGATCERILGVATQDILVGHNGYITTFGLVHDLNLSAFLEGDEVFLSETVSGGYRVGPPTPPYEVVNIGTVLGNGASNGTLYANTRFDTSHLAYLQDVLFTYPLVNGDILTYNSGSGHWVNQTSFSGLLRADFTNIGQTISGNLAQTGTILISKINSLSGYTNNQIEQTGQSAINYTNSIGSIISGNLEQTGINLQSQINGINNNLTNVVYTSGTQFISGTKYFYGNTFIDNLFVTGSQTVIHTQDFYVADNWIVLNATGAARDSAIFISTGITGTNATGAVLGLDVPSNTWRFGFGSQQTDLIGLPRIASGEAVDIVSSNLFQTGADLFARDSLISGGLEVRILQSGQAAILYTSGASGYLQGQINAVPTSGQLALTGSTLYILITGLSGSFDNKIAATGNQAWNAANNNGINLSGNLTQTGISLSNRDLFISGLLATGIAQTGSILDAKINSVSGFVGNVSGGLEIRIAQTGASSIAYANSIGQVISGNLTVTGQTLQNRITGLSGVMETMFVHRSGNEIISGRKQFLNGLGTSGVNFNGASGSGIFLQVENQGGISFYGTGASGSLFSIDDNASGSLFAVTDLYEAPILEVFDDGRIVGGAFNSNALFVSGAGVAFGVNNVPTGIAVFISGNTRYLGHIFSGTQNIYDIYYPRVNPSGYINSGALIASGNAAIAYANSVGQNVSGSLTLTGQTIQTQINSLSGFVTGVSGRLDTKIFNTGNSAIIYANGMGSIISGNLTQTGQTLFNQTTGLSGYILGLINAASAGVVALNGVSGVVNIYGTGGASVINQGQNIFISGSIDASLYATILYVSGVSGVLDTKIVNTGVAAIAYSNGVGVNLSGNLQSSGSYLYNTLTGASGSLVANIAATGNQAWSAANNNGINLSGNMAATGVALISRDLAISGVLQNQINAIPTSGELALTGSNLYVLITGLSGQSVIDYATKTALTQTGQILQSRIDSLSGFVGNVSGGLESRIAQSGQAVVNYANGIGSNLSGNLTATGQTLFTAINSLSGFTIGVSGALQTLINNADADVSSINGQSGALTVAGTGGITILSGAVGLILVSGDNSISGFLTQSGALLNSKIDTLSGFVNNVSGGLETRIAQTGQAAFLATSGASGVLQAQINTFATSAQLYQTGSNLYNLITGFSGQSIIDYAAKTQLTQTGIDLINRDLSISGGLETRIATTGNATINYANGVGSNLSGNLTLTGQTLQTRIDSLSGFVGNVSGGLEARITQTGNAATNFANGIGSIISGNLTTTGQTLYQLITGLSGQANTNYATVSNLALTGSSLYILSTGLSGSFDTKIAQTGSIAVNYANGIGVNLSGNLTVTGQTLQARIDSLSGFVSNVSGGLETRIFQTGNAAINFANGIGAIISGNLTQTGANLQSQIDGINTNLVNVVYTSGVQFISGTKYFYGNTFIDNLFVTGSQTVINTQDLYVGDNWIVLNATGGARDSAIFISTGVTGASATGAILGLDVPSNTWRFGFGSQLTDLIGLPRIASGESVDILTANLTQTGIDLINRDLSISGGLEARILQTGQSSILYTSGVSGYLQGQINAIPTSGQLALTGSNLYILITGLSGSFNTQIASTGQQAWSAANNNGINLSGNLTQTGMALFNRDSAISGGLEARITATGNAVINFANGIGSIISGNLTTTGQTLYQMMTGLSGQANINYATVANLALTGSNLYVLTTGLSGAFNTKIELTGSNAVTFANGIGTIISGNLTATGATLFARDSSISGGLEIRIAQTGQAAWVSANGAANTISGNLTLTGQALINNINGLSGVMESMFVHRSGNEIISGRKQFLNGLGTSGINFNGVSGSGIFLQVETQGGVSYYGTGASGSLFSIEDNASGSIFAVTDLYEAPILEVFDDGRIVGGSFNSNALFVSGVGVAFGINNVPSGMAVFISGNTRYLGHIYSGTTNIADIYYPRNNPSGYATGGALTNTGIALISYINSVGQTISGNLTQTGATLVSLNLLTSGVLAGRIAQTGSDLYNQIYNTGQTLFNRDASISGGLEVRVSASGNSVIGFANGIGSILSGNITNTGQTLFNFIIGGDTNLSGNLIITGQRLYNLITGLSGVTNQTFINTVFTTGTQTISGIKFFNSGDYQTQKTLSTNYSVSANDSRLYCNNTSSITLTFGSAITNSGQLVKIKLINTGNVYLTGTYTQKFDGSDSYSLAGQYNAYEIHSNGSNWYMW